MKRNIKILTQNCCDELMTFSRRPDLKEKYNQETYNHSDLQFVNISTQYFIDDTVLLGISPKDDCMSSKTIFGELMHVDKVQANDMRLWTCLTHTVFFDYTRKRWNINAKSSDETIMSRFHFEGVGIEARMRNAISRLWWAAKITYDDSRDNKFELTELLWEKQDVYTAIVERSFGTYPNLVHGFLDFFKGNRHLKEDDFRILFRGLNAIGGVKILAIMSKQEIVDELKRIADFSNISIS